MDEDFEERDERFTFPMVFVTILFLIFLTVVLGFVGGWSVAMGLMFAGVL